MRLRNKPWARPLIAKHKELVIENPKDHRGKWHKLFGNDAPIHIEVGMGKGQFIVELARKNPEINFIGLEIQAVAVGYALKKQLEAKLPNLLLVVADGADLCEYFEDGEVSQLYLNFSDPWPKKRNAKRRLTFPTFLKTYEQILTTAGNVVFKTDNRGLFEYSLQSMNNYGMVFDDVCLDLHHDEARLVGNVMTEYEQKFYQKGPIYRLIAHFNHEG